MSSLVIAALAVTLLATTVVLARSRSALPWPAILVAALTAAVCFTVGGGSAKDTSGPSVATVTGAIAGFSSLVAAIMSLAPSRSRSLEGPASRTPILLSVGGIALGAVGLLLTLLAG